MNFPIMSTNQSIFDEAKCDMNTDFDDKGVFNVPFVRPRRSMGHDNEFHYFEVPVTPSSDLFLHPTESPGYKQLNQKLSDLYLKFELEIEPGRLSEGTEKTINVKNTACSSLMQRRNKSQKSLRCHKYY